MAFQVGIRDLRLRLSETLNRVRAGGVVEITDRGTPIARIVPLDADAPPREPGSARGLIDIGDDFDACDGEITRRFESA